MELSCPSCNIETEVDIGRQYIQCNSCEANLTLNYDYYTGAYYDGWWFLEEVPK